MKASETKLRPIIEGTKQYVVPLFQRPYSWNKEQWQVLWDDLVWLCENEEPKSHFIGSIVTMPTNSVPEGVPKFLLIDGQQRLTTIFLLLAVLRDTAAANGSKELALKIEQTLLVNPFEQGDDHFRLMPTQVDRDLFRKLIKEREAQGDSQIVRAYQFFSRKIRQESIKVDDLVTAVTARLSVVSIVLDQDDNAHLVFESLNAKGRPLTQSDLIRNYFFMRIPVDQQEAINAQYWEPMQVGLGENLTECIRHYLMRTGAIVKQPDVYFTLKERVGQTDAVAELKRLNRFAGYYRCLLEPDRESNLAIRRALLRLRRFELTITYPFMLNCYDDYDQRRLAAEDFLEVLKAVENYIMRRWVCNYPSQPLNKIFPLIYRQAVQHGGDFVAGVKTVLIGRQYPSDGEFKNSLLTAKLYGAGERREKTKLLLEALEESYGHKEAPDFAALTIEHVMPQTLNKWWQDHLGEDWESDHELYVDTLGNLTLTAYNSELSNASFPEKQSHYSRSHVELNKYFSALTHWDRAAIEERAGVLAQRALEIYPHLGGERVQSNGASDITGSKPHALSILGQRFRVNAWRDVLETTLNALSEIEPEGFERAVQRYHRFLGKDPGRFRAHRQLKNGLYFEVNLSSREIYGLCTQIAEEMGLSNEDWRVEY